MRPLHALLAALTAVFVVVVGLPAGATAAPSSPAASSSASPSATSSPTPSASDPADGAVTLTVAPADDGVLVPGRDLVLDLTVRNTTADDVEAGTVRVYLDRAAFATRSKLAGWLAPDETSGSDYLGTSLSRVEMPAVPSGSTQTVASFTVPASLVALDGYTWGARALGARLVGDDGAQLAQARSSVVWYPGESFQATRFAVAVPITTPESETGVLDASALAAYTSSDGTLSRQLRAVQGTGAAVGVDPMIIASIRLLGSSAPASALEWLDQLQSSGLETFALAWADADVAALSQADATVLPTPTSLSPLIDPALFGEADETPQPDDTATPDPTASPTDGSTPAGTAPGSSPSDAPATGGTGTDGTGGQGTGGTGTDDGSGATPLPTTESLLSFPYALTGVAWPASDTVVARDLDVLAASGTTSTILSSSNVDPASDSTENAAVDVAGKAAVVSDDSLVGLVSRAAGATDDVAWSAAMAELSASVATVARERPSDARTLLAGLGRDWSSQGPYLHRTLEALATLPWVSTASLADAAASAPSTATLVDRPEDPARVGQVRTLLQADQRVVDLGTALEQPELVTADARLRTLALSSHAWRDNPDGFVSEVAAASAAAGATAGLVTVVPGSDQLILGDRSSMPLYVENGTGSTATVYLTVAPSNSILSVEQTRIPVTVQARSQARVRVPVQSVANGTVTASITLTSGTGATIGTRTDVAVNVQAGWETAITWVFAVGFLLLFGGGLYRTFRKRRRAREARRDHDPEEATGDPAAPRTTTEETA